MHDMKIRHKENCRGWKCRTEKNATIKKCGAENYETSQYGKPIDTYDIKALFV